MSARATTLRRRAPVFHLATASMAWVGLLSACVCSLIALPLAPASPAWARALNPQEKADLAKTVTEFDTAMRESRFDKIVETMPPRVLGVMAGRAGVPVAQMRDALIATSKNLMESVKMPAFGMDLAKTEYKELPSGTPYAVIPTSTIIESGPSTRIKQNIHTIALLDGGKWYLVRIDDAKQIAILREAYPEFTGVEFPRGTMEAVKQ
jgi:hypothetical protein